MGLEKQNNEPMKNQCSFYVQCPETEESQREKEP